MKKDINIKNQPVGIFDSGVGGLTVFREIEKIMPQENIIYFGDTARVPYGNKSAVTVKKFSVENILFLLEQEVKMVIVACNTSSALSLDYLRDVFRIPILGVIDAGVKKALAVTSGRVGVIGTKSTIDSCAYAEEIKLQNKKVKVFSQSCPLFVSLVEEGLLSGKIVEEAIRRYLGPLKENRIDTLILGCTHYPLLKREIADFLDGVKIVDSAQESAKESMSVLKNLKLFNGAKSLGERSFFVSDEPLNFTKLATIFLGRAISKPRIVDV